MSAKTLGAMVAVGLVVAAAGVFVGSSVSIQKYPHKGDDCRGTRSSSRSIRPRHTNSTPTASSSRRRIPPAGFPAQAQGKTKYKCDIKDKTPAGLYKYRILIKGLSEVDPWVVNY